LLTDQARFLENVGSCHWTIRGAGVSRKQGTSSWVGGRGGEE